MLTAVKKINLPEWILTPQLKQLRAVLNDADLRAPQTLLVGGCVRNALINATPTDIDLATKLPPEDVMRYAQENGFKAIPTGLDHGTVTVVVDGQAFEITTLRKDVETDGRHAEVNFTDDWIEDAKRRDFTINSLLADLQGNVFDPLGDGVNDLDNKRIVFIDKAAERIGEDHLRILRFFRFYAQYGQGEIDAEGLKACAQLADKVYELSRERITQEFLKILAVDHADDVLKIMIDNKVLLKIIDQNYQPEILERLCALQIEHDAVNIEARLFVLAGNKSCIFEDYLRLSHAQLKFIIKLEMALHADFYGDARALKKAIFYHGNDLICQGYLLAVALGKVEIQNDMINFTKEWQAPVCPITGQDLLAEGYQTGPELGVELKQRQEEWLESVI